MADDIYTKREIVTHSKEHVVPNFLGGRLQYRGLIDRKLNSEFGSGIDAALDRALLSIRTPIDARSDRAPSTPAPTIRGVVGADGNAYRIEAGGRPKIAPKVSMKETGGALIFNGQASEVHELHEPLKKFAKRKGWDPNEFVAKVTERVEHRRELAPMMNFPILLWDRDPYRAVVKMACNLFAHHHRDLFLRAEFDAVREFVLHGTGLPPSFVQATDIDIRSGGLGPLDHLVTVDLDTSGNARGMVILFGVLAFVVRLGDTVAGHPSRRSYRVDQLGRADRHDHEADDSLPIEPFDDAAARSYEEFTALAKEQLHRLLPVVLDLQKVAWIQSIVQPHWDRLIERKGDAKEPTEQEVREFASDVAEALVADLLPRIEAASRQRREEDAAAMGLPSDDSQRDDDED